ncbi:hypothetical protein QAD02_006159 [Eretmocerus hayati]|uniref:Uncharacterized protein n=1 Tax=Eretmocerus hayati TaxID=131215 RepID=A0ACC2N2G3_9HYME|nr:hypothetical protein QAD02_006159 [Eretmocerus hayati]
MFIKYSLILLFGTCIQIIRSNENHTAEFDYKWTTDHEPQDPQFYILELNNTVVRATIVLYPNNTSADALLFKPIDPKDISISSSCIRWVPSRGIPFDKDYWQITNLENGKIVAMSSVLKKIFVIDMAKCETITIDNQNGDIVPYDNSFDLIRYKDHCDKGDICITRYDDQGIPMSEQVNITINSDYKPLTAFSMDNNKRHVVIRYTYNQCGFLYLRTCYKTVVDILSQKLRIIDSFTHGFLMKTFSKAHGHLNICGNGDEGIECGMIDLKKGLANYVPLNGYWACENFINVHNMKDGGMVLLFCSISNGDYSGCEMMFYAVDAFGRELVKPTFIDGENNERFVYAHRDADPYFKPTIIEKNSDDREYCFVIPGNRKTDGKCFRIPSPVLD